MKAFNYVRAWRETAAPLFAELPPSMIELYHETRARARDCKQDVACRLEWPAFPDLEDVRRSFSSSGPGATSLRDRFKAANHDQLALAAAVIHDYGHWRPSREPADLDDCGGHWRFSNYADQVLAANLDLRDRFCRHDKGFSLRVLEGQLRGCVDWPGGWTWTELGLATRANLEAFRAAEFRGRPSGPGMSQKWGAAKWDAWADASARWLEELRAELVPHPGTPLAGLLRAGELYMDDQYERCRTCGHVSVATSGGRFLEELEK